jgi:hypothetical protein
MRQISFRSFMSAVRSFANARAKARRRGSGSQETAADPGDVVSNSLAAYSELCAEPLLDGSAPWSSGTMRPAGLAALLDDINLNDRRRVLECGSGLSTLILARCLHERGGRLVALEHDPHWASSVASELKRQGLQGTAEVVEAPLESTRRSLDGSPWYSEERTATALQRLGDQVDLLVVDGPPAFHAGTELSRYPALPTLLGALTRDCTVVLDDAHREGERQIVDLWEAETPLTFELRMDAGEIARGHRPEHAPLRT